MILLGDVDAAVAGGGLRACRRRASLHGGGAGAGGPGGPQGAGLSVDDIDVIEVNEAFAAQALAVMRDLKLPEDKTNPNGSGVSLGHPIGATGCILTVKALYELHRIQGRYALVTMCIGGGQGIAAIFEREPPVV
jgi:hypothetical protein